MAVIVGTAGHIDHGKTSLIAALTDINCDRLEEEKRRGITIDLGFAWLDLPNGDRLGIIDVPGHERFVRTMVAGACGMDLVLLVIAADEGIMPQTREHLEICSLLGVKEGLVALTKIDCVDEDWLAMVTDDVQAFLAGSFLENASILPVSSTTKQGIPELRGHLISLAEKLKKERTTDIFRLPIDRVFSLHGHGTVVTGTVLSGAIRVGDTVVCMPGFVSSKARSLERHGTQVENVLAGSRCAINLQGLETTDITRGQVVSKAGELFPAKRWFLKVKALSSAPFPLKQRGEIHFHHGTKECTARLVFREGTELAPGQEAFAEALFTEELCGVFGDHCVLRTASPLRTVAGAELLSPLPPLWPKKKAEQAGLPQRWKNLLTLRAQSRDRIESGADLLAEILDLMGLPGAGLTKLRVLTGLDDKTLDRCLSLLISKAQGILWDKEERAVLGRQHFDTLCAHCLSRAEELHRKEPLKAGFAREAFLGTWSATLPKKLVQKVFDALIKDKKLSPEGDGLRLATHTVTLAADEEQLAQKIMRAHKDAGHTPPNYKDVLSELGVSEKEAWPVLTLLVSQGRLVRIKDGLYYEKSALEDILTRVRTWFQENDNLDIAALKSLLGLSRKYLVNLLEYMDNAHITVRVGDARHLRQTN